MSATEDESQNLDAGWDDEPAESEVDEAWDSVVPAPSAAVASASIAPTTEEVDEGWEDAPSPAPGPPSQAGKRRPHRQRRAKTSAASPSAALVLAPRPAERNKKDQRTLARQQRAHEAQVKQQRKLERKAEREAVAKQAAAERLQQAEAQGQARRARQEARERAQSERPAARPTPKKANKPKPAPAELKRAAATEPTIPLKKGPPWGVIALLVLLGLAAAFLLLKKS